MSGQDDPPRPSRRAVLRASGGVLGLATVGTAAADDGAADRTPNCPDATIEPEMRHYERGGSDCSDDHPATRELQEGVRESLERRYPTVGALIDADFIPYFDVELPPLAEDVSHWINPEYLGDDAVLDPVHPESVLVDNQRWRAVGVMFIATRDGERIERPPPVYGGDRAEGDADADAEEACAPWHYHVGLPGRFAWWYYRQAYEGDYGRGELSFPCRTPYMLHVWAYPHPESVYAHDAPPAEYRGGPPADDAGFDTTAEPGEDRLDRQALPDEVLPAKPSGGPDGAWWADR